MSNTPACFKAYDIRGRVPDDLSPDLARRVGVAYVDEIKPNSVVVGRDMRLESPVLAESLIEGLTKAGADVIDIGLCGTEEVYFQTFDRQAGGGIMVTASHNPKGYNGMKLVREGSRPISGDSGLNAIAERTEKLQATNEQIGSNLQRGKVSQAPEKNRYIEHLLGYIDRERLRPLRIVADPGNGMAGPVVQMLAQNLPFDFEMLHSEPDGNFPNGVPNPLLPENREATSRAVIESRADFGIAWDGDFDRCFLFDEQGRFIEGYYIVGLLAQMMLVKSPGARIIHDPRLTWNTIDLVTSAGGTAIQSKTGHAFIKERMRQDDAAYGGEMSAHHYFRDFAYCDSGMIPWLLVAELLSRTEKPLSELVDERIRAFPCSGEINFRVGDAAATLELIEMHFAEQDPLIDRTDGLSLEFDRWRLNVRASNTEPLLRLNVESRACRQTVAEKIAEVERLIQAETDPH